MKKSILPILPILTLILLLTHPALSFTGAKNGLLLWWSVVLPTLLPFMLCSSLLVAWGGVPLLVKPFAPLLRCFGLSPEGSYALIAGLLCGYPMGAKTTADFLRGGFIRNEEGRILLAAAGWPSPMFLAGYIAPRLAPEIPLWKAALALYLPLPFLLLTAGGLCRLQNRPVKWAAKRGGGKNAGAGRTGQNHARVSRPGQAPAPFDEVLMNALEIKVKIGGFLMIYSILAAFISSSGRIPARIKPFLSGIVEMTTGIDAIARSMSGPASLSGRAACAAMLACAAFGGLSGVSQTNTVIKNAGLSIRHYVLWKLLHAALAAAILLIITARAALNFP